MKTMKSTLKLATRILLGYLVPCIVFTAAVIAVYLKIADVRVTVTNLDRAESIVERSLELQLQISELQRWARGALLYPELVQVERYEKSKQRADVLLRELTDVVRDPEQRTRLASIKEGVTTIMARSRKHIDLARAGQASEGVKSFQSGLGDELYIKLDAQMHELFDREKVIAEQFKLELSEGVDSLIRIGTLSLAIALGVSVAASDQPQPQGVDFGHRIFLHADCCHHRSTRRGNDSAGKRRHRNHRNRGRDGGDCAHQCRAS